jgi:hypothetical protein
VVEIELGQVLVALAQSFVQGIGLLVAPDLDLDGLALPLALALRVGVRPAELQIDAPATDAVLVVEKARAVDDALQVRHEHELRRYLVIHQRAGQHLAVLA